MRERRSGLFALILLACWCGTSDAAAQTTERLVIRGQAQTLRLYGPGDGEPVIVSSGDGGWIHLGPHVAEVLAAKGFFVVGFDAKAYLESFTSGSTTLRSEQEPAEPLKTNFTPSESTFNVFNPSLGIKHELVKGLRAHFTVGRAFIPAEASMLTGFTTTAVSGRTQITQGNPDLKPERSTSFDAGAEWTASTTRFDVTAFRTVVRDRFISNVVVSNPPAPDPIIVSVANGLDAHISGLDLGHRKCVAAQTGALEVRVWF
jgi:hypothetical protein